MPDVILPVHIDEHGTVFVLDDDGEVVEEISRAALYGAFGMKAP